MIHSQYSIIIPVKPVGIGKSRLRATIAVADALVTAIALDTIAAAMSVSEVLSVDGTQAAARARSATRTRSATGVRAVVSVLVVTNDPDVSAAALSLGADVTPDTPDAGLNAAIAYGDSLLPAATTRAALTSDLPALRAAELASALAAFTQRSAGRRGYVADHMGTGTTLLVAPPGVPLAPQFGLESAHAHAASGALALDGAWPSLRLDVDTRADLAAARALGLGPRTEAAWPG
jgi:2-phospho-L-lactate/phosphoenolpyruvate guanylyltransferase